MVPVVYFSLALQPTSSTYHILRSESPSHFLLHERFLLIFILLLISLCFAASTNRTIDDGLGDVVTGLQVEYLPLNSPNNTGEPFWKHEDQCNGCAILPDRTKAFDETWTATTYFLQ